MNDVISYTTAMTIFKKWLAHGDFTIDEFDKINEMLLAKYNLEKTSIFRIFA